MDTRTARDIRPGQDRTSYAVSPAAMSQLEAVRDEWLRPLIDQIATLSREAGHLEEQRNVAQRQVDAERRMADQMIEILERRIQELEGRRS